MLVEIVKQLEGVSPSYEDRLNNTSQLSKLPSLLTGLSSSSSGLGVLRLVDAGQFEPPGSEGLPSRGGVLVLQPTSVTPLCPAPASPASSGRKG